MAFTNRAILCALLLTSVSASFAQGGRANAVPPGSKVDAPNVTAKPLDARNRFVYDVVRAAVALPQTEPQDRLRVLAAASAVISPIRPALAKTYSREGLRLEQDLIQRGVQPSTSMLSSGAVDCKAAQTLVESIQPQSLHAAETTLLAAISICPATVQTAQRLMNAGLEQGAIAPRLTLALAERAGVQSAWSREHFEQFFSSLPENAESMQRDAPEIASFYSALVCSVEPASAKTAGLKLLLWLGRLKESGDRTIAIKTATEAMKSALGEDGYEKALASDVNARQVAVEAGKSGEISQPAEESASVQHAMQAPKDDRTQQLEAMPAPQRAREAAASGFASGTNGDPKLASRYFDLAFASLNTVWHERQNTNASAIVQEVSEAAAQVNATDALRRTRSLDDTAAQAIGMIAVARVVANQDEATTAVVSRSR